MNFHDWFAVRHPQISIASANAVLKLAEGGATVPFIARYRKEETGNLDEVGDPRRDRRQGALGRDRQAAGVHRRGDRPPGKADARAGGAAPRRRSTRRALEDLYLPYKQKRKTKAAIGAGGGPGAAGRLAVGLRARRGAPAAGETPEARAAGIRRRREGRRRRGGRAGGRGRHRDRAPVRGRGPAPAGAHGALRAGLRAHAQGRQGQDAPAGSRTTSPIRSRCASC